MFEQGEPAHITTSGSVAAFVEEFSIAGLKFRDKVQLILRVDQRNVDAGPLMRMRVLYDG